MKKTMLVVSAMLLMFVSVMAEMEVKPYGAAQYRLRLDAKSTSPEVGDETSATNYSNRISYKLGTKVKVNDAVSLGFQYGNNSVATETIDFYSQEKRKAWFHQAWAKLKTDYASFSFGVLPVKAHGTLDLIDRTLHNPSPTYAAASYWSWAAGSEGSLEGLKLEVPILKDGFKLGLDITYAVTGTRTESAAKEPLANPTCDMYIVNIPMAFGNAKITPEIVAHINKNYNSNTEKGDHELGYGASASYKINDMISLNTSFAMAGISNAETRIATITETESSSSVADIGTGVITETKTTIIDTSDAVASDVAGMIATIGANVKIGPGKLILAYKFNTTEEKEVTDSKVTYGYTDIRYGFCLVEAAKKNITLMPRLRIYNTSYAANKNTSLNIRPEMLFIGKF